ncbi:Crp/Fnr family transcriptional regulator [Belnapia sp. T6]|uniref:Crp/Fnr family transcriptional regulator n=1 Tax=Belnapia mucosa TaxID=2804532 RepID=A0ABS1V8G3_9PROT|nr:Crp/Fnr family transcriptional regulator [Belnapia mucosa]MBL6457961.1 Crp/Fnr family transcriptional regulator [Belnapia mucosa]
MHSLPSPSRPRNRLLNALPPEELEQLWPRLEPVDLNLRAVVQAPAKPMQAVHFIESGWCSMVATLENGDSAEVGIIGLEGMIGLPLLLDDELDDLEGMVQSPGTAFRMAAPAFREALDELPGFARLLRRYSLVHHGQVARTAACNGRHLLNHRLARWLLMAHDRSEDDIVPVTHEFLAMMLGVRRAGVTVAASALQKSGLIRYASGRVTITDRPGLEAASCECYHVVRRAEERLFEPRRDAN